MFRNKMEAIIEEKADKISEMIDKILKKQTLDHFGSNQVLNSSQFRSQSPVIADLFKNNIDRVRDYLKPGNEFNYN